MKLRLAGFGLIAALLLVVAPAATAQGVADWTFMMFMNADTNLEEPMMEDLREIAAAGSTDRVNMVAQVDRIPDFDDDSFGGWTDTRLFYITQDTLYEDDYIENLGETNNGDAVVFEAFLDWTITNLPAERYMLVLSNHGAGWSGLGSDETNPPGTLSLQEIDAVLGTIRQRYGIDKFDIVAFDACLMSQLDVLAALAPHADYTLAAAELVPGAGYDYTNPLNTLNANPTLEAAELGQIFIDYFMEYHAERLGEQDAHELYLMDLSQVENVVAALDAFVAVVGADPETPFSAIGVARNNAQAFADGDFGFIDLVNFMEQVIGQDASVEVETAAQTVIDAAVAMRVYGRSTSALPGSRGLSVYFPFTGDQYVQTGEQYVQQTPPVMLPWESFFTTFHNTASVVLADNPLSMRLLDVLTAGGEAGSVTNPPSIIFEADGRGIIGMDFGAQYRLDDGRTVLLVQYPIAFFTTNENGDQIASYSDGYLRSEFLWDGRMTLISDGTETIPALVQLPSASATTTNVEGVYYAFQDGEPVWSGPARLVFSFDTQRLMRVWGTEEGEYGPTEFEISPNPGDIFSPYFTIINEQGEIEVQEADPYISFTGNNDDIFYTEVPADTGTWLTWIRIQDMTGNIVFDTREVEINNTDVDPNLTTYRTLQSGYSFIHPFSWNVYTAEDSTTGTVYDYLTDPDGNATLYLNFHEVGSLAEVQQIALDSIAGLEQTASDVYMFADTYEAQRINYTFADSETGETYTAAYLIFYVPEHGGGYIFDFIMREPAAPELDTYVNLVASQLTFFEPLNLDEMEF